MTATAAEALELALWLHRAPARRAALLGRPLPDGIGQLLRVASGARDQVAAAATITGVSEATVLEAVRFYVQQVLFHEDADAYRVLGLHHSDSQERAREHHRLLQQWLHPDRAGQDAWESVYAVRINQAWSQLRTPQNRAAYDAAVVTAGTPGRHRFSGESSPPAGPISSVASQSPRTRSRNLTLLVLLGCAGLLVMIAMRREEPPEWPEDRQSQVGVHTPEAIDGMPFAALGTAVADAVDPPVPNPPSTSPPPIPPVVPAAAARPEVASVPGIAPPAESPARPVRSVPVVASEVASVPLETSAPPAAQPIVAAPAPEPPPTLAVERPVPVQVPDPFGRMAQAQARTHAVLGYLRDPGAGLPPVWNDVRTMQDAVQIRTALHLRQGRRGAPVELQAPQWRLSAEGARLESRYRAGAEQGRLDLAFTWRENQLLVSGIALDPDA